MIETASCCLDRKHRARRPKPVRWRRAPHNQARGANQMMMSRGRGGLDRKDHPARAIGSCRPADLSLTRSRSKRWGGGRPTGWDPALDQLWVYAYSEHRLGAGESAGVLAY